MRAEWRKYLSMTAPRYTSYPSALYFTDEIGETAYRAALVNIAPYEPISIYVHIPFCAQLCWYCGCNMRVENIYARTEPYLAALKQEIALVSETLAGRGRTAQIHFGGGTPNYLHAADLASIIEALELGFGLTDATPIAMEIDPRLCTPEKIAAYAKIGINRMSLGVQDFDPFVQTAINRVQSFELIDACVAAMRMNGIDDISFDLLYGLPRQKLCTFMETLRKTISLSPDRISLFGYAHLPERISHQRLIETDDLPSTGLRADLADCAEHLLTGAGYQTIGFDHFAKSATPIAQASLKGQLNRNFQGFTEDAAQTIIGLGASAISAIHGHYFQNEKAVGAYNSALTKSILPISRGVACVAATQFIGDWIKGLLCHGRADVVEYNHHLRALEYPYEVSTDRLTPFADDGLIQISGSEIIIAPAARRFSRLIAAQFDPMVEKSAGRLSPAI